MHLGEMTISLPSLSLQGGDPDRSQTESTPATCTRFILPFAYQLTQPTGFTDGMRIHWKAHTELNVFGVDDMRRRRYFTQEISDAIFEHAKRFRLSGIMPGKGQFKANIFFNENGFATHAINLQLSKPELTLFEWPHRHNGKRDLLQLGLLSVELTFVDAHVDIASVLKVNELYRYVRDKYAEQNVEERRSEIFANDPLRKHFQGTNYDAIPGPKDLRMWFALLDLQVEYLGLRYRLHPSADLDERHAAMMIWPDDRAFVHGCGIYPNPRLAPYTQCFANAKEFPVSETEKLRSSLWCKWLNVDSVDPSLDFSASAFERSWAQERSYTRWLRADTLYGFSSHSAMMLSSYPPSYLPTHQHFRSHYFDQTCLLLYLRSALLRFSLEISKLARRLRRNPGDRQVRKEFRELDEVFALFVQMYQFPQLSNQQQAVEMYTLQRQHMDVNDLFAEVQDEIRHMHQLLDLKHDRAFRVFGIMIAVMGLLSLLEPLKNLIQEIQTVDGWSAWCKATVILVLPGLLIGYFIYKRVLKF
jgi:hypothetical protein